MTNNISDTHTSESGVYMNIVQYVLLHTFLSLTK